MKKIFILKEMPGYVVGECVNISESNKTKSGYEFHGYDVWFLIDEKFVEWVEEDKSLYEKFAHYIPAWRKGDKKYRFDKTNGWTPAEELAQIATTHFKEKFDERVADAGYTFSLPIQNIRKAMFGEE